jgi:integrase
MNVTNPTRPPSYRLHKASGQAVVTIDRKDHYLGLYGTGESRLRYERLITAWMQGETAPPREPDSSNDLTVAELCAQYLKYASTYYTKDGEETSELQNVRRSIRALRETFASLPAKDFSPLKLEAVRDRLVADGLSRVNCNRYTGIAARIFRYAVAKELVPPGLAHGLEAVKALARGRGCKAHETEPVLPVDNETVERTMPFLSEQTQAMVKLQLVTAMRPAELVSMRTSELDRSGPVWVYRPAHHKNEHHSKSRVIPIGPRARLLLAPWLQADPDKFIFGSRQGGGVSVTAYRFRIHLGCDKAGIDRWNPNQLRHSGATRIRQQASLDAAQVILGHSNINMTETYAERNLDAALRIAAEVG